MDIELIAEILRSRRTGWLATNRPETTAFGRGRGAGVSRRDHAEKSASS